MRPFLSPRRLHRELPIVLTILVPATSCGPTDAASPAADRPTLGGPVEAVTSPAREGSGEPHLSSGEDGVVLSWLEPGPDGGHLLRLARWEGSAWGDAATVVEGKGFFVNWADFPSVVEVDGTLYAHWLERGGDGTYDYGVRIARSSDGGRTWSPPWTPHTDGTPTEHGFVSIFPHPEGGAGLVWLDGRRFVATAGAPATEEMTLRTRRLEGDGTAGPESLLDGRICDCCQTDAVATAEGPLVVYRDRDAEEIRDIYVTRLVDGAWTEGRPVHADGWHIPACPVNGPAADARDRQVAVAWFTQARDTAAVKVAFSEDAGASFGAAARVDDGNPAGRVDVVLLTDGSAVVSWIERVGEGRAELRARRVRPDGTAFSSSRVSAASAARASGFPQMVPVDGRLLFAWTDVAEDGSQRIGTAVVEAPGS